MCRAHFDCQQDDVTPTELIGDTGQQTLHIDHDTGPSSQNTGQVKAQRPICVSGHLPVQKFNMEKWEGRAALVTGASMGSGRAIAKMLASHGMRVAACARSIEKLQVGVHEFIFNKLIDLNRCNKYISCTFEFRL